MEDWARSSFVGETGDETLQRNSAALGQVFILDKLQEVSLENIQEVNYDNRE